MRVQRFGVGLFGLIACVAAIVAFQLSTDLVKRAHERFERSHLVWVEAMTMLDMMGPEIKQKVRAKFPRINL